MSDNNNENPLVIWAMRDGLGVYADFTKQFDGMGRYGHLPALPEVMDEGEEFWKFGDYSVRVEIGEDDNGIPSPEFSIYRNGSECSVTGQTLIHELLEHYGITLEFHKVLHGKVVKT